MISHYVRKPGILTLFLWSLSFFLSGVYLTSAAAVSADSPDYSLNGSLPQSVSCAHLKISPPITTITDGVRSGILISPDSKYAIYAVAHDDSYFDLYSSPVDGSSVAVLLADDLLQDEVGNFLVSPDSQYVVYMNNAFELLAVPMTGGVAVPLTADPFGSATMLDFVISPDSSAVVFIGHENDGQVSEVFSVPITGGAPVRLNSPLGGTFMDVYNFKITGDSSTVVYLQATSISFDGIYSVPVTGGTPVPLFTTNEVFSGTGSGLYVTGNPAYMVYATTSRIVSVPVTGGTVNTLVDVGIITTVAVSPDGAYVIYLHSGPDNIRSIYSVPTGGGMPVELNEPLNPNDVVESDFQISPDNNYVVFNVNVSGPLSGNIYVAKIDGNSVNALVPGNGGFQVTPGNLLLFRDNGFDLARIPLTGGSAVRLSQSDADLLTGPGFITGPSGLVSAYNALFTDFTKGLFVVRTGGGSPLQVNDVGEDYDALTPVITPDDAYIVFRVKNGAIYELYSTAICTSQVELLTNGGFEIDVDTDGIPDDWTGKNTNVNKKDKRKCNTDTKTIAYSGECAFFFMGNPASPVGSRLIQTVGDLSLVVDGAGITLSAYLDRRNAPVNHKVAQVKVQYTDGSNDKLLLRIEGSGYTQLSDSLTLDFAGRTLDSIKADVRYKSTGGKYYVDEVSLQLTTTTGALHPIQPLILPLPVAPAPER